jgi:cytochrome c-type biogenesis protein CcsB
MRIIIFFISLISILITTPSQANDLCLSNNIGEHAVLQNGRVKPLYVHSNELIKYITGKSKVHNYDATQAYCRMSLSSLFPSLDFKIMPLIEHVEIKKILELKEHETISAKEIEDNYRSDLMLAMRKESEGSSLQKSIQRLLSALRVVKDIRSGTNWMIPTQELSSMDDFVPLSTLFSALNPDQMALSTELIHKEITARHNSYTERYDTMTHHQLEYMYAKMRLPLVALLLTCLAIASFVLFRNFNICLGFSFLTIIVQLIYITIRVIISGRAPITNMYETVLFSGFVSLLFSLIIGHFKKEPIFVKIGLGHNLLSIFMLNFSGGMLSASIGPLVPVLRDNFWLSTHVTSIIASYGALALSWVLANALLIKNKFTTLSTKEIRYQTDIMYTCLKFGIVLLSAGIILGGVWADYSWGRFWGWDPKETWSLIVLCIYMIILHGRYTNWITERRFIPFTALAFLSVMMAWFGVNYILAAGLHSYGFSEGGAIFLGTFFAIQIAIIAFTAPKILKKS